MDRRDFLSYGAAGLVPIRTGHEVPIAVSTAEAFNVQTYGAKGNGVADDTNAIQAATDAARVAGGGIVSYPLPPVAYRITDRIQVAGGRVTHRGDGWGSVISQATFGKPVFEVRHADDVTIENLKLVCSGDRVVIGGTYDGEPARGHSAGVYGAFTNRLRVKHVGVHGFTCGVTLRGRTDKGLDEDNLVEDCLFSALDWGVLAEQQRRLRLLHLTGTAATSQVGNPAHLVYLTGGAARVYSEDCQVHGLLCYDNVDGHGFQFKFVKRLTATSLTATRSLGLLTVEHLEDSVLTGLISVGATNTDTNLGDIYVIGPGVKGNLVSDVLLTPAGDSICVNVGAGSSDNLFTNVQVTARMTPASAVPAIYVRGTRNRFVNIRISQLGAPKLGIVFSGGTGHQLEGLAAMGCSRAVEVAPGASGVALRFDDTMITPH
jgi:hypothetical protein